jgi:NAD(P)-dependent dehydrogenase (short-subunit alcohol dehydrogenase family)
MSTALITGASRGFGRALAAGLVAEGWTVIASGRDAGRLARTRDIDPSRVITARGDVRDRDHLLALVAAARRAGGLDLLVHNASALGPSPLPAVDQLAPHELSRIFAINAVAPLALTQLALPLLLAAPQPALVALSSDAAVEAYPGWSGYGSSKAALDQLMGVLAVEQPSLAVYAFDPADMRTDMHQRAFPGEDISDRPEPETVVPALLHLIRERPPSGRYRASDLLAGQAAAAGAAGAQGAQGATGRTS